jgi:thiol-disulfide isomerase/thioredoxin
MRDRSGAGLADILVTNTYRTETMTTEETMLEADHLDAPDRPVPSRVTAVLVTAQRCHFCRDAWELLSDLSSRYPITVRSVDLSSTEGTEIATRYRVPFPPVLLLDGEYFGHGRISRKKLTRTLDAIFGVGAQ